MRLQAVVPVLMMALAFCSAAAPGTCYTKQQDVGTCTKTSMCDMTPPKVNSATLFVYRTQKNPSGCAFLQICCPKGKIRPAPVKPTASAAPGCGYSNPAVGRFRQRTGTSNNGYADFAEFPWMVALLDKKNPVQNLLTGGTSPGYLGGGTLIHASVVLTVAHKVDTLSPSDLICRAGEWDTENENESYLHQDRDVRNIVLHPQFNRLHSQNNIALLFLVTPFLIEPHVNVACLSPTMPPPGTLCYSMGWGQDFTKGKYNANVLKKIPLPLVRSDDCERNLRNTILGQNYYLHDSLTCAGGVPGFDTCIGDGGSSLVCPTGDLADLRYTMVGMVVYGLECGQAVPSVYAKMSEFYNWISYQMTVENINGRPYELN